MEAFGLLFSSSMSYTYIFLLVVLAPVGMTQPQHVSNSKLLFIVHCGVHPDTFWYLLLAVCIRLGLCQHNKAHPVLYMLMVNTLR